MFPAVSKELIEHLERSYPPLVIEEQDNRDITDQQLRFRLGQQSVLRLLRTHYVIQQKKDMDV